MHVVLPSMHIPASALLLLLDVQPSTASPAPAEAKIVPRALHGYSVFIQQWCADCESAFGIAY